MHVCCWAMVPWSAEAQVCAFCEVHIPTPPLLLPDELPLLEPLLDPLELPLLEPLLDPLELPLLDPLPEPLLDPLEPPLPDPLFDPLELPVLDPLEPPVSGFPVELSEVVVPPPSSPVPPT